LNNQVDYTIQMLRTKGVGRNDRIAIVMPNGPEMAVALLAVSSIATSAPLNPASSEAEFEFYLSDLRPKAMLVGKGIDSRARTVAHAQDIPTLELSPIVQAEAGIFALEGDIQNRRTAVCPAQPDDVALALYTSGTTSRPKLVPLTHTNLYTSAVHLRDIYELGEEDRCLNVMPLFHLHGLAVALLVPLAACGSVVCTPGFDASRFFGWVDAFKPTWYTAVPSMHVAILAQAEANRAVIARRPLRFIGSRSAALPVPVLFELERVFGAPVLEAYGLTETSPTVASNRLAPARRKPGSVGQAAGPKVAIMAEGGNLLPAGQTGEIVVRGVTVFRGYDGNPEANKDAFLSGWFRTGDQGYLDDEGYLFVSGRLKEIINRGGEKVAPREVDDVLMDQPSVAQAVAFAIPHPTLGEDIAAAVVLREGAQTTAQQVREWAFDRLAAHKVPSQIMIVDQLPAGPTGKVQRSALVEELADRLKPLFASPENWIEDALISIWTDVLGKDQIGVLDNFFALGGDSLTATQLVSRVRARFHVELMLESVFREPTLAGQALVVEELIISSIESLSNAEARHAREQV
jgi:acyl-CoA synthetase (AMP-forming)/AMP-acid ligase II